MSLEYNYSFSDKRLPAVYRRLQDLFRVRISPYGPFSCHTTGSRLREKILKHL